MTTTALLSFVEWASAARPFPGESVSGDACFLEEQADGARVLAAAIDGLGHGPEASRASQAAVDALRGHDGDVASAFDACNAACIGTRGVAMTVVEVRADGALEWSGIGNVEAFVLPQAHVAGGTARGREHLTLRGGVVGAGARLNAARVSSVKLQRGDVVVLTTDGITVGGAASVVREHRVDVIADELLARFAKVNDDALVLVMRYTGEGAHA